MLRQRVNFYLDQEQLTSLKKLGGTVASHIRMAISEYLLKLRPVSASKSKGSGDSNG